MPTLYAALRCILPLVLGVSYAVAFLPPPYALDRTATALYTGHVRLIHWRWEPPAGYHPAILRDAVDPLYYIRRWPMWSAAARRDPPDGQHPAVPRPWTKPTGYDPAHRDIHYTDEARDSAQDLASAPGTTRWTPPIGYDPAHRDIRYTDEAHDSAQDLASAPGTTRWTPPIGYDPTRRRPRRVPWTPPMGYDPASRRGGPHDPGTPDILHLGVVVANKLIAEFGSEHA